MKYLFALISALLFTLTVSAQESSPDALIKNVTNEVLDIVRNDKDIQSGNTKKAMELIEAKVLPYLNQRTLEASGIEFKPFFMRVAKVHR